MTARLSCCGNSFPFTYHSQAPRPTPALTQFIRGLAPLRPPLHQHPKGPQITPWLAFQIHQSLLFGALFQTSSLRYFWLAGRGARAPINKIVSMLFQQHQYEFAQHFYILCCKEQGLSAEKGSVLGCADVLGLFALLIVHESSLLTCSR